MFWAFGYPTGDPEALLALGLRKGLQEAYDVYPNTKDMVMVSYSLGGLVGKMQVQTTGDTVWQKVFTEKAAKLWAELPADFLGQAILRSEPSSKAHRLYLNATFGELAGRWTARPDRQQHYRVASPSPPGRKVASDNNWEKRRIPA